jgi:cell division protein ZapA
MSEQEISIKVNICDRFYPLRIKTSEEEGVRNAVNSINDRAKYYNQNFSIQDKQDALSMVALEFASGQSKTTAESNDFKIIHTKLKRLEQLLEI